MNFDAARAVTDFSGLAKLKAQARADQETATEEVAQQFEALFIQMMLKRMRAASFGGGLLDSQQSLFYRDLYDQQLASHLSARGGMGLADTIERQLGGNDGLEAAAGKVAASPPLAPSGTPNVRPGGDPAAPTIRNLTPSDAANAVSGTGTLNGPRDFVRALWPAAQRAARDIGVDPAALLAQAALETGWGKHVMRHGDGRSSHNLFGIKADHRWDGDRVRKTTLEYKDGVALQTRADFRAYDSYAQAFGDYVDFVKSNPRYRHAIAVAGDAPSYFTELQKAGYATDPAYAQKISGILQGPQLQAAVKALKTTESRPI